MKSGEMKTYKKNLRGQDIHIDLGKNIFIDFGVNFINMHDSYFKCNVYILFFQRIEK